MTDNQDSGRQQSWELSRRMMIRFLGAGVAGSALAGQRANQVLGAHQAEGTPAVEEVPTDLADEQVLRVATGAVTADAVFTFSPLLGGGDQQNWQTLVWMPPLYFDSNGELQPGIFSGWEANEDFSVWTFSIDSRAQWSDGTPVSATDVKGTWELMTDPLTENVRIASYLSRVEGFEVVRSKETREISGLVVVDDATLQVTLIEPEPIFHWRIATTHMNPVKIDQVRGTPQEFWKPENNPAVSGPYMLESFDPANEEATMIKNPNWWLDEGPYLDKITFRNVPDQQILAVMAQNDEVDATLAPLPRAVAEVLPDFFRPYVSFGFNVFWFNLNQEPTNDLNVRKALIHSVDFEDVFSAAYPEGAGATRSTQLFDKDFPCYDAEEQWYAFDPDAAKAALAASSYGSAENLPRIRVTPHGQYPPLQRALESIIEFWRQNLGITNVEYRDFAREWAEEDWPTINVSRNDNVIRFPDVATYMYNVAHSNGAFTQPGITPMPFLGGYSNPEIDVLLDEALLLPVEDPTRCDLPTEAQRLFLDEYPVMFLAEEDATLNARGYVRNYVKGPDVSLIEPWKIYIGEH